MSRAKWWNVSVLSSALCFAACSDEKPADEGRNDEPEVSQDDLLNRAYIVSLESEELTVIDTRSWEIIGRVPTGGSQNHMAELNADFTKIYVDSSRSDETVVLDARKLQIDRRILTGKHPTHLTLSPNADLMAIMLEDENAIAFLDTKTDEVIKKLEGFHTPHFMRFSRDGKSGYVANIGSNHLTRVNMDTLEIVDRIGLEGLDAMGDAVNEGGFADAQIDETGTLYAAHAASGRVLVYDTQANQKLMELPVGKLPWIVFAEHPFHGVALTHMVPNFGDRTVSLIDGTVTKRKVVTTVDGDEEAYGVNFSSINPRIAYVMNRVRSDVAVVDTEAGEILERLEVGGNTETASTTPDGRYVVAAVSSANRVVVIDVQERKIKKIFENVGAYPWSVTIPGGQNYCH
jgi:DNA-binding beta-propeller fold protein YncE